MIEDTGGIDDLESQVLVIQVPYEQGLGCECEGLDLDIGSRDAVDEGRLANAGYD